MYTLQKTGSQNIRSTYMPKVKEHPIEKWVKEALHERGNYPVNILKGANLIIKNCTGLELMGKC